MKKLFFLLVLLPCALISQQSADTTYHPEIKDPAYADKTGPVVCIDEGHHNFHTMNGRYKPFAMLLERDGYNVEAFPGTFRAGELESCTILVIANALSDRAEDYTIPDPSAFTEKEIETLKQWVSEGGSLFLIADHMPMADASKDLAGAFDFKFTNGFVFDSQNRGIAFFRLEDNTLADCIITRGRDQGENIHEVVTFTGQAFQIPDAATSILTFSEGFVNFLPDTAWVFDETTARLDAGGWSQGAFMEFGKGKIAVFGEAAMFTAQVAGPERRKAGMNSEYAPENYLFLLNIIHWLDGKLD